MKFLIQLLIVCMFVHPAHAMMTCYTSIISGQTSALLRQCNQLRAFNAFRKLSMTQSLQAKKEVTHYQTLKGLFDTIQAHSKTPDALKDFKNGRSRSAGAYTHADLQHTNKFVYQDGNKNIYLYATGSEFDSTDLESEDAHKKTEQKIQTSYQQLDHAFYSLPQPLQRQLMHSIKSDAAFFNPQSCFARKDMKKHTTLDDVLQELPQALVAHYKRIILDLALHKYEFEHKVIKIENIFRTAGYDDMLVLGHKTYIISYDSPLQKTVTMALQTMQRWSNDTWNWAHKKQESIKKIFYLPASTAENVDPYTLLGVSRNASAHEILRIAPQATTQEIQNAYYNMRYTWEQSVHLTAPEVIALLKKAYESLNDKQKFKL